MEPGRRYRANCAANEKHVCRGECARVVGEGQRCNVDPCMGLMLPGGAAGVPIACGSGMMCREVANGLPNEGRCVTTPPAMRVTAGLDLHLCDSRLPRGTLPRSQDPWSISDVGNVCPDWSLCIRAGTRAEIDRRAACTLLQVGTSDLCTPARIDGQSCDSSWNHALAHAGEVPVVGCAPCAPGLDCLDGVCRRECTDPRDTSGNGVGECPETPAGTTAWNYVCTVASHMNNSSSTSTPSLAAACTPAAGHLQLCPAPTWHDLYDQQRVATTQISATLPGGHVVTVTTGNSLTGGISRGVCTEATDVCGNGRCCTAPTLACQSQTDCCRLPGVIGDTCTQGHCCSLPTQRCGSDAECCFLDPHAFGVDATGPIQVCCNDAAVNHGTLVSSALCAGRVTNRCGPTPCGAEHAACCTIPLHPACLAGLGCAPDSRTCEACGFAGGACCPDGSCGSQLRCESNRCIECGPGLPGCGRGTSCQSGLCLPCGGVGQPCCPGLQNTTYCTNPLACVQGVCRSTCGAPGQPCCDRVTTASGWTGTCSPGAVCVAGNGLCAACGVPGQPCCANASGSGLGTCDQGAYCAGCNTSSTGCCTVCGRFAGDTCCPAGSASPPCGARYQCNPATQQCQACGATEGGPCCGDGTCWLNGTAVCDAGVCRRCGDPGQPCCPVSAGRLPCNSPTAQGDSLVCAGNVCTVCGGDGSLCCAGEICNSSGSQCLSGTCVPCGARGQTCCLYASCPRDSTGACDPATNQCEVCGAQDQICCAGSSCGPGLTCDPGTHHCVPCGSFQQPCCYGTWCDASTGCDLTTHLCQACGSRGQPCCRLATCPFDSTGACNLVDNRCECGFLGGPCCPAVPGPVCQGSPAAPLPRCVSGTCQP